MKPVLVSDGTTGQAASTLGAVRALAGAGREVHVGTSGRFNVAAWSRHCARAVPLPSVDDPAAYRDAIEDLVARGTYDHVLVSSDAALLALDWSGADLVDKAVVAERATAAGFSLPTERVFSGATELLAHADELSYPLVVKPIAKHEALSLNVFRCDGPEDLLEAQGYDAPLLAQGWIDGALRGLSGVFHEGRLRAAVHQVYPRTWPRVCGMACNAITTAPNVAMEERLGPLLEGFEGMFNIQYFDDTVIDINPRVYGSVIVSAHAGVNFPDLLVRLVRGDEVVEPPGGGPLRGREGIHYRWVEGDLRSVADGVRSGDVSWRQAASALRPVRRTVHADVDRHDLLPLVARGLFAVSSRVAARRGSP